MDAKKTYRFMDGNLIVATSNNKQAAWTEAVNKYRQLSARVLKIERWSATDRKYIAAGQLAVGK